MRNYCGLRCSASARYEAYCYFFCLKTVPQAEPTPHHRLRAELPLKGKPKSGSCRADRKQTFFAPNTETFSAMHNLSVAAATGRTRSPGGLGGRSRIEFIVSPLPRRRHNESHFAAQSPERAFLRRFRVSGFCLRSFARAKNGVNSGRRSRKISVTKAKSDRLHHNSAQNIFTITSEAIPTATPTIFCGVSFSLYIIAATTVLITVPPPLMKVKSMTGGTSAVDMVAN